jgi:hypothetical protein
VNAGERASDILSPRLYSVGRKTFLMAALAVTDYGATFETDRENTRIA